MISHGDIETNYSLTDRAELRIAAETISWRGITQQVCDALIIAALIIAALKKFADQGNCVLPE